MKLAQVQYSSEIKMAITQLKQTQSNATAQAEFFSDFLDDFTVHPVKKDLVRYTNENAVKQSIKNLLFTNPGERVFNNNVGSNIRSILFEQMTPATEKVLENQIRTTIDNFEPRAKILDVTVTSNYDNNALTATIIFSLINSEQPITLELILDRIR